MANGETNFWWLVKCQTALEFESSAARKLRHRLFITSKNRFRENADDTSSRKLFCENDFFSGICSDFLSFISFWHRQNMRLVAGPERDFILLSCIRSLRGLCLEVVLRCANTGHLAMFSGHKRFVIRPTSILNTHLQLESDPGFHTCASCLPLWVRLRDDHN